MSTVTVSVRLHQEKAKKLAQLAEATDRPKSWHVEQALENYLDIQAWQIEHIKKGLADVEAGRLHPHSVAMKRLDQWVKRSKRK